MRRSRHLGSERAMPSSMSSSASRGPMGAILPSRSSAPSSTDSTRLTTASCWWLCGIAKSRPAAKIHVLRQWGLAAARRRRSMTSVSGPVVSCHQFLQGSHIEAVSIVSAGSDQHKPLGGSDENAVEKVAVLA